MNGSPLRHVFALRQRPLAFCLACALGTGTATGAIAANAAGPSAAGPGRPDTPRLRAPRINSPADLPAGSPVRAAWEQWLAHPPPARPATTIPVTNCNDSGAGSLRDAVANAVDGDTIDMTGLTCSSITLTTGSTFTGVNNLTLNGPGSKYLSISGNYNSPIIEHIGTGTLSISDFAMVDGKKYGSSPRGGCIFSGGDVELTGVVAAYCQAAASPGYTYPALGGAVYAAGNLALDNLTFIEHSGATSTDTSASGGGVFAGGNITMYESFVSYNTAFSSSNSANGTSAIGGGIYAVGTVGISGGSAIDQNDAISKYGIAKGGGSFSNSSFDIIDGTVSNNAASAASNAFGGGVVASYGGIIKYSTISDNYSSHNIGGIIMNAAATGTFSIIESTISGNSASNVVGGVYSGAPTTVYNSTIAFNTETSSGNYSYTSSAGLNVYNQPLTLQSSIIAQNTNSLFASYPWSDLGGPSGTTVTGTNNLVRFAYITVPGDTIVGTDPVLLPLANNGGLTDTHALSDLSPAVDAGNNAGGWSYDQRGAGYPRVVGANADIGAYEGVVSDEIFINGFD